MIILLNFILHSWVAQFLSKQGHILNIQTYIWLIAFHRLASCPHLYLRSTIASLDLFILAKIQFLLVSNVKNFSVPPIV